MTDAAGWLLAILLGFLAAPFVGIAYRYGWTHLHRQYVRQMFALQEAEDIRRHRRLGKRL